MQVFTNNQLSDWFAALRERNVDQIAFEDGSPYFSHPEANCIQLEYPPKLERLPFFARYLATLHYERTEILGAMIWVAEWGIWSELDEAAGYRLVENLNSAAGQPSSFEQAPAHSFRADELFEAVGLLLQTMVFGWDAFYVPRSAYGQDEFFVHVSHDGFVNVVTRTKESYERVFADFQRLNLSPKPGNEHDLHRFCRK